MIYIHLLFQKTANNKTKDCRLQEKMRYLCYTSLIGSPFVLYNEAGETLKLGVTEKWLEFSVPLKNCDPVPLVGY